MKERSTDGQHAAVMSDVAHEGTGLGSGLWRGWVKGYCCKIWLVKYWIINAPAVDGMLSI